MVWEGESMITKYLRLSKLGKYTAWCILFAACLISVKLVSALDSTSISVNGTSIYTLAGGYNSSHGIAGVSFDVGTKTLTLTNASLDNITADDDLIINLVGTNTITSSSPDPAIRSEAGNVTIIGEDEASLVVNASADDGTAIRIGSGKRLTIGDGENLGDLITVSVSRGVNMNTEDTYVVTGNTYNAPEGELGGPPAGDPIQISIGGTLVIDETADPQIISASGEGWTIN